MKKYQVSVEMTFEVEAEDAQHAADLVSGRVLMEEGTTPGFYQVRAYKEFQLPTPPGYISPAVFQP